MVVLSLNKENGQDFASCVNPKLKLKLNMGKKSLPLIIILNFLFLSVFSQSTFNRGVNLPDWFQADNVKEIHFSKYTKQDFENIKSLGCDVIRLPINLHFMTNGPPDYTIEPLFYDFLDEVIGWVYDLNLHLILDNHTFKVDEDTDPEVGIILEKVWRQMAAYYKNHPAKIYYEVLNEPHGINNTLWCRIQQGVIDVIRSEDTEHTIIVGPADWNDYALLKNMPPYSDTNLIYTFHFYNPFMFTHQGASWTSMEDLGGVPFPYDASKMPECPVSMKGQWQESALNSYPIDGTVEKVKELIDIAADFENSRGVRLLCGEMGVLMDKSDHDDRVFWYNTVCRYLEEKNIPWTIWGYQGSFGIFEKGSHGLFEYDLDTALLRNLGLNIPEQKEFTKTPDREKIVVYSDFIGENLFQANFANGGTVDYYSQESPFEGKYNIKWTGSSQYGGLRFDFNPDRDFSLLIPNNFKFDLCIKGDTPGAKIQVRFVDSKTSEADHPWRISFDIDESTTFWDGQWHRLQIPLSSFQETGSWDNGWFNPEGKFDWSDVNTLEIIAEFHPLDNIQICFDDISVNGEKIEIEHSRFALLANNPVSVFPNPFYRSTTIRVSGGAGSNLQIMIFNLEGKIIKKLSEGNREAGVNSFIWNGTDFNGAEMAPGIYICKVTTANGIYSQKIAIQ